MDFKLYMVDMHALKYKFYNNLFSVILQQLQKLEQIVCKSTLFLHKEDMYYVIKVTLNNARGYSASSNSNC